MGAKGNASPSLPLSASALDTVPHMPGCAGPCDITEHVHSGDGRIEYPGRYLLPVRFKRGRSPQVVHVRWCVRAVSESPEVWIERLAWADKSGVHVSPIEIVVNDAPGSTPDEVRHFARLMESTAQLAEQIIAADQVERDGALDVELRTLLEAQR
ncbi:hypothetical protein [Lentzea flava]|uniref:Uncharacterized protein n=1 Tax=Lentzea flava TaxID=103732 RepID=A0ABQ2UZH1_9PSEU|nr:hypothetical protein [Lentzea flava]MCP2202726.1 hypothetical protein [Lentzea flava]GGU61627.1 hypothetical protein GCM10010178_62240 [Lentzea flava]